MMDFRNGNFSIITESQLVGYQISKFMVRNNFLREICRLQISLFERWQISFVLFDNDDCFSLRNFKFVKSTNFNLEE